MVAQGKSPAPPVHLDSDGELEPTDDEKAEAEANRARRGNQPFQIRSPAIIAPANSSGSYASDGGSYAVGG
eukprot:1226180-Prymnesium_polylepis.1